MTRHAQDRIAHAVDFYDAPDDVLDDETLTTAEKEKALRSMAADAEQMLDATAEGMEQPARSYTADNLQRALAKLHDAREEAGPSAEAQQKSACQFQRIIVVTTRDQDLDRVALDHGLELTNMSGGEVSLLSVVPPRTAGVGSATGVPITGMVEIANSQRTETEVLEDRKKRLADLLDLCGGDASIATEVRAGPVEEEIVSYAEEVNADVIVIGSPNRSWLEGVFHPSIERGVTKRAPCPVLVVPEPV